ncbi:MAG: cytochrome C554 [Planctomycetes bacterium]|nr:cytochrome C554 [Planctomycetota bacterium]
MVNHCVRKLGKATFIVALLFAGASIAQAGGPAAGGGITFDASKVVGSDACTECHAKEAEAWKHTPHYATWETLHRRPEAKTIAEAMDVRSIKRGDVCIQCHYTRQGEDGGTPISGISCESCHGPAKDWIKIHNNYGGANVKKEDETAEHKAQRIKDSLAAGMLRPDNIYLVAQNCYNCHTVPNEKLVDTGGHTAGSAEFELVSWSQGMVRHNYLRTGGTTNAEESQEHKRVMYAVGVMTDVEYSLRGIAKATEAGTYAKTMARRANSMRNLLKEINEKVPNAHFQAAIDAAFGASLKLNNEAELTAAADKVGEAAQAFAADADGSKLAAIDEWLPKPDAYKGTPAP